MKTERSLLLKKIHEFYPIGMSHLNIDYPGYQLIIKDIETRVTMLMEGKRIEPWVTFVEEVSFLFPNAKVYNMDYIQFPSTVLKLDFEAKEIDNIKVERSLIIPLSRIMKCYSFFFQDIIQAIYPETGRSTPRVFTQRIIYYESGLKNFIKNEMSQLKQVLIKNYPDFLFVSHRDLYGLKIDGGLPHGHAIEIKKTNYPLYDFLFGSDGHLNDRTVIGS